MALRDVMMKGRWEADKNFKRYLNFGLGLLIRVRVSRRTKTHVQEHAAWWHYAGAGGGGPGQRGKGTPTSSP